MIDKIKKLFSKEEPTPQNVKYTIYKYDLNKRSGKWRWRKMVEIEQYIEANQIEDFPEDGYYQLRELSPAGVNVKWTVMVDGGEVVEYDPELPSNIPVVQQQGGQQQDPMQSIGHAIQYLKMQKQMLEELGLIKDPKREMIETLTMLKELEEIKSTASSILKPQQAKSMSDAPWWATAAMEMLPTMASMASQMTPVQQYPVQQYPQQQYQQYQQPVQQQPQPQEEEDDIGFEPPTVEDIRQENMIQEAEEKIQEEIGFVAPEPKPTPEPEPKAPEPKPEPKPKEKIEKPKPVKNNVDKEMLDLGNDLLDDIDEVE